MKRALVTGGSGGIGAAICRKLAANQFHVYVHANHSLAKAEEIVSEIITAGRSAQAIAFDVTSEEQTQAALQTMLAEGTLQVLVNNAGIHDDAVMPGMNAQQWNRVIDVSLNGFFNVTQPLLLPMLGSNKGCVSSIYLRLPPSPATAGKPIMLRPRPACTAQPSRWHWSWPAVALPSMPLPQA